MDEELVEHEYDHVLIGEFDGTPNPSSDEVDDWKWVDLMTLKLDVQQNPENYTYWSEFLSTCYAHRPSQ